MLNVNSLGHPLAAHCLVTCDYLAISSMWEIAALVDVLERKGVLTRQEIYDAITELRQRHPDATTLKRPSVKAIRRPT